MSLKEKAMTGPGVLVIGGLIFWGMAWYLDFWTHVEKFGVAAGSHVHGGDSLVRINFPMTGLPLIVFGMAQLIGTDTLMKRGGLPLFVAGLLFALDGLAHAFAFNDHLGDPLGAAFFAFIAPLQIAAGIAMPFIARKYDLWLALSAAGLFFLYVLSRWLTVPALAWPERVEGLDIFSKIIEVLFVLIVLIALREPASAPRPEKKAVAPPQEAPAESAAH